ncbi:MAG: aminotransferase class V-fold PLP-dependent enzyme [Acutalibacteraceae bacterium]|nr:aminotransferase class V-fold PLP-dependent enzyme [Acutalibacteraceae bacterium]
MNTPIYDFVNKYRKSGTLRLHMPGHKGTSLLGVEEYDITEIKGADSLYEAQGIIKESENNASLLFGFPTFYSTEGSSQCIRAMLFLAKQKGIKRILAGRNAHKAFITACALLDLEVEWLYGNSSYLSCNIDEDSLKEAIVKEKPDAVYITSPDYLGNLSDVKAISEICKKHNILLLVDNAHGAYLKFLENSLHPIDLGADMCCDSAHKTLPCLTGGAYLHIKDEDLANKAKNALSIFGSTSPSYLILQSLDLVNKYISEGYKEKLHSFILKVESFKKVLKSKGYSLYENEPLKVTICTKAYGYSGYDFAEILRENKIECEFSDPDFTVLMLSVDTDLKRLENVLLIIPQKAPVPVFPPRFSKPEKALSVRQAIMCDSEEIEVENAEGKILSGLNVGCPPAVPIAVCGEKIDKDIIRCFKYYGINKCIVIKRGCLA